MCLLLQETMIQVQVLKLCKSIQESSEKVLDFNSRQLAQYLSRFMKLSFLELIFIQSVSMCLGLLFLQP